MDREQSISSFFSENTKSIICPTTRIGHPTKKKTACGRIEDIRIFGDFMNIGDISKLEARLRGAEFRREEIISALEEARVEKYIPNLTADELADIIMKSE